MIGIPTGRGAIRVAAAHRGGVEGVQATTAKAEVPAGHPHQDVGTTASHEEGDAEEVQATLAMAAAAAVAAEIVVREGDD